MGMFQLKLYYAGRIFELLYRYTVQLEINALRSPTDELIY